MAKRIDSLREGDKVSLVIHPSSTNDGYEMDAVFLRIEGQGDDREAVFTDTPGGNESFRLYRFKNRWSIASDARRVSLV